MSATPFLLDFPPSPAILHSVTWIGLTLGITLLAAPAEAAVSGASFLEITPSARSYALGMSNAVSSLGAPRPSAPTPPTLA